MADVTPMGEVTQEMRIVEALLFAATEPVTTDFLAERLPEGSDIGAILEDLKTHYDGRGVNIARVAGKWCLRTAEDLSSHLRIERKVPRKLSRAAIESLAIVAYHQPVTRGEVEEIRGVSVSKGSFDVLLEAGWIKPVGRRRSPGRPTTWGTTQQFLEEFGLDSLADLPGVDELKASGLLDTRPAGTIIGDTGEYYADAHVDADEEEPEALDPNADEDEGGDGEDGAPPAAAEGEPVEELPEEASDEDDGEVGGEDEGAEIGESDDSEESYDEDSEDESGADDDFDDADDGGEMDEPDDDQFARDLSGEDEDDDQSSYAEEREPEIERV